MIVKMFNLGVTGRNFFQYDAQIIALEEMPAVRADAPVVIL
ncbi:hypothetical protein LEP1GSC171_0651 [Leptospira santarosai str. HAI1380]|uniref:Uncharacterized protein n=1 Tax=Leptospira santarosai str. ZUN179 TaxID=1049985 RepID=M6V3V6_9LEPT|nr:hypothetical protein LEP1GSC187_2783 [Leptospira santarosai str. ZUN179]EMP03303.1 hypothetical protein LEP1GSC171_0651 [Leptospira santarosai str. HAI1380]